MVVICILIFSEFSVNRNYSQDSTRPQNESYKAEMNYRGGRVRSATMINLILNIIIRGIFDKAYFSWRYSQTGWSGID